MRSWTDYLEQEGYALPPGQIDKALLRDLDKTFSAADQRAGQRNLLATAPRVGDLLRDPHVVRIAGAIFTQPAFVVRATLFDKQPDANWSVTWHQDQAIAVRARQDVAGFGPWSTKHGVTHVEPPIRVLQSMVALRIHLEDCTIDHGPLVVAPGTHRLGRLTGDPLTAAVESRGDHACTLDAGQVLVIRPLLLHRSSKTAPGLRRRVIHLDLADQPLPLPLQWAIGQPVGQ